MKSTPELLALAQALTLCHGHLDALQDALGDMQSRQLTLADLDHLSSADRRLLDQFAYRYTRLQDDMGGRLMPALLRALWEEVAAMPALDRFARLEQLGWLASAEDWNVLRQIRNQFANDYPDSTNERFERLQAAIDAAHQLIAIIAHIDSKLRQRFSESVLALSSALMERGIKHFNDLRHEHVQTPAGRCAVSTDRPQYPPLAIRRHSPRRENRRGLQYLLALPDRKRCHRRRPGHGQVRRAALGWPSAGG